MEHISIQLQNTYIKTEQTRQILSQYHKEYHIRSINIQIIRLHESTEASSKTKPILLPSTTYYLYYNSLLFYSITFISIPFNSITCS